jgi:hypothetical protein
MTIRSGAPRHPSVKKGTTPFARQNWKLVIGVVVVVLGLFILLLNFSGRTATPRSVSTPIVVRDGLIVKGTGPELYLFKKYALHQIVSPTVDQQAQAQPVTDDFLAQYAHGEPVDHNGLSISPVSNDSQQFPSRLVWWGLGGVIFLLGGGWLLAQTSQSDNVNNQTRLTSSVRQAAIYSEQIELLLKSSPKRQQQQLLAQIRRWRQAIEELAQTVAGLRQDELIQRDSNSVPGFIADLERQLTTESHPDLRRHLEYTLTQRQNQLMAIEQLQTTVRRAEIQIDTTVAVLGTIYSKLLANQSVFQVADYGRLLDEVDEEVQRLHDHLEALKEVKLGHR